MPAIAQNPGERLVEEEKFVTMEIVLWSLRAYKEKNKLAVELLRSHEEAQNDCRNPSKLARYSRALQAIFDSKPWRTK